MPSTPSPRRRSRDYDGSSRGKWTAFADQVVKAYDAEDALRSDIVSSIAELGRGPTVIGSDARGACSSRHAEVQPRGTAGVERLDRYNYSFLTDSSFDGRTSRAGRRAPSQSSAAATGRRRALRRRNTRPCRACWCSPLRGKKRSAAPGDDVELSFGSPRADACSCSRTPARAEVLVEHVEVDEEVHGVVACVNRRSGRLRTTTRRVREKRLLH